MAVVGVLVRFEYFAAGVPGSLWAGPLRRLGPGSPDSKCSMPALSPGGYMHAVRRHRAFGRIPFALCNVTFARPVGGSWPPPLEPRGLAPARRGQGGGAAVARPTRIWVAKRAFLFYLLPYSCLAFASRIRSDSAACTFPCPGAPQPAKHTADAGRLAHWRAPRRTRGAPPCRRGPPLWPGRDMRRKT